MKKAHMGQVWASHFSTLQKMRSAPPERTKPAGRLPFSGEMESENMMKGLLGDKPFKKEDCFLCDIII